MLPGFGSETQQGDTTFKGSRSVRAFLACRAAPHNMVDSAMKTGLAKLANLLCSRRCSLLASISKWKAGALEWRTSTWSADRWVLVLVLHNKAQSSRLEIFLHICSFQADHLHELAALLLPSVVGFSWILSLSQLLRGLSDAFRCFQLGGRDTSPRLQDQSLPKDCTTTWRLVHGSTGPWAHGGSNVHPTSWEWEILMIFVKFWCDLTRLHHFIRVRLSRRSWMRHSKWCPRNASVGSRQDLKLSMRAT